MKAIVFDRSGSPLDVLRFEDVPMPILKDQEVLIRMIAAPISPGDFLFIEGLYPEPKKPDFPRQIAGNHGAGIVEYAPPGSSISAGTLVAFSYYNTWAEYAAVPLEWLIPLPRNYPAEKASQFFNLITAWDLLETSKAAKGDWIAVTAGNSTVSQMVSQFAATREIKVVLLTRHVHRDLTEVGATAIIELGSLQASISETISTITGEQGLAALIDNVGGPITGDLIRTMRFGGQIVINGGMSEKRFELHNFDILLSGLEIRSHVYRYFFDPPKPGDLARLQSIVAVSEPATFSVAVGGMNSIDNWEAAIKATLENPQRGKQFFEMGTM